MPVEAEVRGGAILQVVRSRQRRGGERRTEHERRRTTRARRAATPGMRARNAAGSFKTCARTCTPVAPTQTMKLALCRPTSVPSVWSSDEQRDSGCEEHDRRENDAAARRARATRRGAGRAHVLLTAPVVAKHAPRRRCRASARRPGSAASRRTRGRSGATVSCSSVAPSIASSTSSTVATTAVSCSLPALPPDRPRFILAMTSSQAGAAERLVRADRFDIGHPTVVASGLALRRPTTMNPGLNATGVSVSSRRRARARRCRPRGRPRPARRADRPERRGQDDLHRRDHRLRPVARDGGRSTDAISPALPPHERARRGLARTWQAIELFDDLTVRENLAVAAERPSAVGDRSGSCRSRRTRRGDARARGARAARAGDIADQRARGPAQGQRKLVGVARALAAKPASVCLDEPAAGLDTKESERARRRLRGVVDSGIAMLLVDHDMGLVLGICDYSTCSTSAR